MQYEDLISESLKQIERNLQEHITIDQLAETAFLSRYYYQRLFRNIVGLPVMEYIKHRRLEFAAQELRHGSRSILDIALLCGYGAHESFSRAFRSVYGVSPSTYRKNYEERGIDMQGNATRTELEQVIEAYCSQINTAVILTQQAHAQTEFGHLAVFAEELSRLQIKLSETKQKIITLGEHGFEGVSRQMEIVKLLEDSAFQLHIIAFSESLYHARMAPEYVGKTQDMHDSIQALAKVSNTQTRQMVSHLCDLFQSIYEEIQLDAMATCREIATLSQTAGKIIAESEQKLTAAIDNTAEKRHSFYAIADEMGHMLQEITMLSGNFDTLEHAISSGKSIRKHLPDIGFRMNIIAFEAKLEGSRMPATQLSKAGGDLAKTAGALHRLAGQCESHLEHAEDMLRLLPTPQMQMPEITTEKQREDIAFQLNIMLFHLRAERMKLVSFAGADAISQLKHTEYLTQSIIEDLSANDPGYSEVAEKLSEIAELQTKIGTALREYGGVILVLKDVFSQLAKAIKIK
ncbi:helix-turn-helix transcriptional regulator [Ruminococcaceae bacterium OttesenSCG-928-L11]|nr:helix-turn-helix transcriptional regulator [Ruminococcaceae bacterium OttesenSCG-928-L11]